MEIWSSVVAYSAASQIRSPVALSRTASPKDR